MNGLSCISQLQVDIQCISCNDVAQESATEQTDISVPISQTLERGNGLQEYINAHFSKEESKVCKKCNRQTKHVSQTQFHKLPNLLVIRLDRGTYRLGSSISKDNTTVALNQVVFCKSNNGIANLANMEHFCKYQLVSVMTHVGKTQTSGHFECYAMCENQIVLKISDDQTKFQNLSDHQNRIESCSYMHFYFTFVCNIVIRKTCNQERIKKIPIQREDK